MNLDIKKLTPQERYRLIDKLIKETKLRKYSYQTGKAYIEVTSNVKHKLILMFLYYAGLRLDEVRNLKWQDIDFDRDIIHIKTAKGEKERVVFFAS